MTQEHLYDADERIAMLEAENASLREALEPFAEAYDYAMRWGDEVRQSVIANSITLDDCEQARAALQPEPK